MKTMKYLKLAAAGVLGLFLTAQASAQAPIGQPVFEGHSASFVFQDAPVPVMDTVAAPTYMPVQQDCFGSMSSFGNSIDLLGNSDLPDANAAYFTITLPETAKLFVAGRDNEKQVVGKEMPTASEGPVRYFVVRRLEPGVKYWFQFRAEMENAAGVVIQTSDEVVFQGGETYPLTFMPAVSKNPWQAKPEKEDPAAPAK